MKRKHSKLTKPLIALIWISSFFIGMIGVYIANAVIRPKTTTSNQSYITVAAISPDIAVPEKTIAEKINLQRKIITPASKGNLAAAAAVVKQQGGKIISQTSSSLVVELPKEQTETIETELTEKKIVDTIEVDYPTFIAADTPDWGVSRIEAPEVWSATGGNGIRVAVIDTGIDYSHPDLRARYSGGYDTANNDSDPFDDNGHGTHVAGTIAADLNDSGLAGVAPKTSLYAVKAMAADGTGYISDLVEAVDWAMANNMQVINFSLGTTYDSSLLRTKIKEAASKGIMIVGSAGNTSGGAVLYPAAYGEVISVSATDSSNSFASFSSLGAEVAAPGVAIRSTIPGGGYASWSGTSMAAPHVTATIALMLANGQQNIREQLRNTATDLGPAGVDSYFGYGLINAKFAAFGKDVLAPVVTFISPEHNSTVSGTVSVTVDIQDESNITSAQLVINNSQVSQWTTGGRYTYSWDTAAIANGEYQLLLEAVDEFTNKGQTYITVKVDQNTTPTPSPIASISPTPSPKKEQGKSETKRQNQKNNSPASASEFSAPSAQEFVAIPTPEPKQTQPENKKVETPETPATSNSQQRNPTEETVQSLSVTEDEPSKSNNGQGKGLGKVKGLQSTWWDTILSILFKR